MATCSSILAWRIPKRRAAQSDSICCNRVTLAAVLIIVNVCTGVHAGGRYSVVEEVLLGHYCKDPGKRPWQLGPGWRQ